MNKFCSNCGAKLDGQKFCPECGASTTSLKENQAKQNLENSKDLANNSSTVKKPIKSKKPKKNKGCLIAIIIVGVFALILGISLNYTLKHEDELGVTAKGKFMNAAGVTDEQGQYISDIYDKCVGETVQSVEHDELLDKSYGKSSKGYRVATDKHKNIITYIDKDGTLINIRYAGEYLYKDGKAIKHLTYGIVPDNYKKKK